MKLNTSKGQNQFKKELKKTFSKYRTNQTPSVYENKKDTASTKRGS